jgi:hypothetical protein
MLRHRGVQGDDATLAELIDAYGAHALTLDHLGGLTGQFLGGDARRAPEVPVVAGAGNDRQALRLARLLRAYEEHLPPAESALLCRLCLLRRNLTEKQIRQLFLCSPAVHARTIRELREQIAHLPVAATSQAPHMESYANAVSRCLEEMLCAAPIAEPENLVRQEVLAAAAKALELPHGEHDPDFIEFARLYAGTELDAQTDLRPLPPEDRAALRQLCARYLELRANPYLGGFKGTLNPVLADAFAELGLQTPGGARRHAASRGGRLPVLVGSSRSRAPSGASPGGAG